MEPQYWLLQIEFHGGGRHYYRRRQEDSSFYCIEDGSEWLMELVDSDFDVCNLKNFEFHLRSSNYIALRGDGSKGAGVCWKGKLILLFHNCLNMKFSPLFMNSKRVGVVPYLLGFQFMKWKTGRPHYLIEGTPTLPKCFRASCYSIYNYMH